MGSAPRSAPRGPRPARGRRLAPASLLALRAVILARPIHLDRDDDLEPAWERIGLAPAARQLLLESVGRAHLLLTGLGLTESRFLRGIEDSGLTIILSDPASVRAGQPSPAPAPGIEALARLAETQGADRARRGARRRDRRRRPSGPDRARRTDLPLGRADPRHGRGQRHAGQLQRRGAAPRARRRRSGMPWHSPRPAQTSWTSAASPPGPAPARCRSRSSSIGSYRSSRPCAPPATCPSPSTPGRRRSPARRSGWARSWSTTSAGSDTTRALARVVAGAGAALALMHVQGTPETMQVDPRYDDVVAEVLEFLAGGIDRAVAAGVARERIWVDPGIGFGKTRGHNLFLLRHLAELRVLGAPVLVGTSRKRFIGALAGGRPPDERLRGDAGLDRRGRGAPRGGRGPGARRRGGTRRARRRRRDRPGAGGR